MSSQVISVDAIVYLGWDFLSVIHGQFVPNMHHLPAKGYWKLHDLEMTFQGHHRSYLLAPLYTLSMVSYLSLTVSMGLLTCTVCLQKAIESCMTLKWAFKVITSHICWCHCLPIESCVTLKWPLSRSLQVISVGTNVYLGYGFLFVITCNSHHGPNRHHFKVTAPFKFPQPN